jgi:hypothetical protein
MSSDADLITVLSFKDTVNGSCAFPPLPTDDGQNDIRALLDPAAPCSDGCGIVTRPSRYKCVAGLDKHANPLATGAQCRLAVSDAPSECFSVTACLSAPYVPATMCAFTAAIFLTLFALHRRRAAFVRCTQKLQSEGNAERVAHVHAEYRADLKSLPVVPSAGVNDSLALAEEPPVSKWEPGSVMLLLAGAVHSALFAAILYCFHQANTSASPFIDHVGRVLLFQSEVSIYTVLKVLPAVSLVSRGCSSFRSSS